MNHLSMQVHLKAELILRAAEGTLLKVHGRFAAQDINDEQLNGDQGPDEGKAEDEETDAA